MEEQWSAVSERPDLYFVSTHGKIRNRKGELLRQRLDVAGYPRVNLCDFGGKKLQRIVHRLVAVAFIPNPLNKPTVNHIDGNRANNNVTNLEWATMAENNSKKVFLSATRKGRGVVQLSPVGDFIHEWPKIIDAASSLNLSHDCIGKCCQRRPNFKTCGGFAWKYVEDYRPSFEFEQWRFHQEVGVEISSFGRIRTKAMGIIKGTANVPRGYATYKGKKVHRLVASAFPDLCPKPDGADVVNHKDGNKLNNKAENLEWTTQRGNANHALDTGLTRTRRPVRQIRTNGETRDYISIADAARQTGLSAGNISEVCRGKQRSAGGCSWIYIEPNPHPDEKKTDQQQGSTPETYLTDEELDQLLASFGF
jgi:hypothetical protein